MLSTLCCFTGRGGSRDDERRKGKYVKRIVHKSKRPRTADAPAFPSEAGLEDDRRHRLTNLNTLRGLTPEDYFSMKDYISYENPRTSDHINYWTKEQELIFFEYYAKLKKYKVCVQKALDFTKLKDGEYFSVAAGIVDKMGRRHLLGVKCNYNIELVL